MSLRGDLEMSKEKYFINVSFSSQHFNKFAYSVVEADIETDSIHEIAKDLVRPKCKEEGVNVDHVNINVTAFNLV